MAYTVDEVSDTLEVPRPTLYRYIREYSVPHQRRAGKIYVPEESFDRIQEIRELHREGLDTESVRRRLLEGGSPDVEELAERLDRISETLEDLRGEPAPAVNGTAQTLRNIQARQSVLISEVSNLTEMLEDLLVANGLRRVATPGDPDPEVRERETLTKTFQEHLNSTNVSADQPPAPQRSTVLSPPPARRGKFGALTRRRRRGGLLVLLALLSAGALTVAVLGDGDVFGTTQEESSESAKEETPAVLEEEVPAGDSEASSARSSGDVSTTSNIEAGYEEPVVEQPPPRYPIQEFAPEPLYQDQPVQQGIAPEPLYQDQPVPQPGGMEPAPVLP